MSGPRLKRLLGLVIASLVLFSSCMAVDARPSWRPDSNRGGLNSSRTNPASERNGSLQEVAAPGAVDQLRRALSQHRPVLTLTSPKDGSVINTETVQLSLTLEDWPLVEDPEIGLGPHVVVQVDDRAPLRLTEADQQGHLQLELRDLEPGSHRFSAWAAYPWGEPNSRPEASVQWRLHLWQELRDRQPDVNAPWLVTVHPPDDGVLQPLPLNWLIWNAPLQNLRDNDERWRLRVSIDGDSFLVSRPEGIWLKAPSTSRGVNLQMELLNGQGDPLDPVFNNQLVHLNPSSGQRPAWLKAKLNDDELARFVGQPPAEAEADPEPERQGESQEEPPALDQPDLDQPNRDVEIEDALEPVEPEQAEPQPVADVSPTEAPITDDRALDIAELTDSDAGDSEPQPDGEHTTP
ncbi:MAG: hypothetical protein ACPHGV_07670 [Synechococcus sp.]